MSQSNKKSSSTESSQLSFLGADLSSRRNLGKQHYHRKKKQQEELSFNKDKGLFVHLYMLLYTMVVTSAPAPAVAVSASSAIVSTCGTESSAHINITEDDCWLI